MLSAQHTFKGRLWSVSSDRSIPTSYFPDFSSDSEIIGIFGSSDHDHLDREVRISCIPEDEKPDCFSILENSDDDAILTKETILEIYRTLLRYTFFKLDDKQVYINSFCKKLKIFLTNHEEKGLISSSDIIDIYEEICAINEIEYADPTADSRKRKRENVTAIPGIFSKIPTAQDENESVGFYNRSNTRQRCL